MTTPGTPDSTPPCIIAFLAEVVVYLSSFTSMPTSAKASGSSCPILCMPILPCVYQCACLSGASWADCLMVSMNGCPGSLCSNGFLLMYSSRVLTAQMDGFWSSGYMAGTRSRTSLFPPFRVLVTRSDTSIFSGTPDLFRLPLTMSSFITLYTSVTALNPSEWVMMNWTVVTRALGLCLPSLPSSHSLATWCSL